MPQLVESMPRVEYQHIEAVRGENGWKKGFIHLTIHGLKERNPEAVLNLGQLGFARIVGLTPQPLGEHFSVIWDGDIQTPRLSFDGWTDGPVRVAIEVTGR